MYIKTDPGPCPVDDAPHTTCTAPAEPLVIVQLPGRDGYRPPALVESITPPMLVAQVVQRSLAPGAVTTGTYGQSTPRVLNKKRR